MGRPQAARWGVAAVLGVLGACNFDPTRTCQTNADCVGGAYCDPGTGTCVQSGSPAVLHLTLGAPPARTSSGPLIELDPGFGADAGAAFRRDESTTVTVTSDALNLDAGSIQVTVTGVGPGAAPVGVGALAPCSASTSPFCLQGMVSFGPPVPLEAFRGVMQVTVSGADTNGNAATPGVQAVPVTRWRWSLQLGGPIRTSPAVGATGRIYVGTDAPDGRFHAVTPEGAFAWAQPLDGGAFVASPAVGAGGAGETVYVASAETGHCASLAVSGASGAVVKTCDFPATIGGGFFGSLALVQTNGVESGVGVCNDASAGVDGQLVSTRPAAPTVQQCLVSIESGFVAFPGTCTSDGPDRAYNGSSIGLVRGFAFLGNSWGPNSWGGGTGFVPVGTAPIAGIGVDSNGLFGSVRTRGAFGIAKSDGSLLGNAPDGGLATNPGSIVIAPDGVLFGNGDATNPQLLKAILSVGTATSSAAAGAILAAPLLAAGLDAGTVVYDVTQNGYLEMREGSLAVSWTEQLAPSGGFAASPNADCRRDDAGVASTVAPGILYVASTGGQLFSVLTDTVGVDTRAPWPRYQHDGRSTGNSSTPLTQCP